MGDEPTYEELAKKVKTLEKQTGEQVRSIEKLNAAVARLQRLIAVNPAVIYSCKPEGEYPFTFISENITSLLGYSPQDFTENPNFWTDHVHPDDRERVYAGLHRLLQQRRYVQEYRFQNSQGTYQWLHDEMNVIVDSHGALLEIVGYWNDITDRRRAELALRESLQESADIIESIPSGFFVYQHEAPDRLILLRVNPEAEQLTGITVKDWAGKEINEIWPKAREVGFTDSCLQVLATGKIFETENLAYEDERLAGVFKVRVFPMPGNKLGVAFENITEQKRVEEKLHLFRDLIDQSNDAVYIVEPETGRFLDVNEQTSRSFGYSRDEILSMHVQDIDTSMPDRTAWKKHVSEVRKPSFMILTSKIRRKDGSTFPAETNAKIIKHGDREYILAMTRDLTERKTFEAQLRQAQKMEAIGTLAGGIAHDFNNILGAILGYTSMALEELEPDSTAAYDIRNVEKAGKRAKDLVKQIVAISRRSDQELKPLRVQLVIKEALKFLRSSIPTTIAIKKNINPDCAPVLADPTQIHQIIMNLCTNAYHAMMDTGGVLGISLQPVELTSEDLGNIIHLSPGSYLQLEVSDTGHGMNKDVRERIFEPYFTTKGPGVGTGLGLAIVHGMVMNFGGDLTVYSEPGKGSTFQIYLPVVKEWEEFVLQEDTTPLPTGNERILLVDDDEDLTRMTRTIIEQLGYTVTALTSSVETLEMFRQEPDYFDLLISDLTMPNLTGTELAEQILAIRPEMPIVLCSGYSELINAEQAKNLGIRDFIMKPVIKRDFAKLIRKVLDNG